MIVIDIETTDAVSADLGRLNAALAAQADILDVAGAAGERVVQDHFQKKDNDNPNKRGFSRKHFWGGLAAVTGPSEVRGSEAIVTIHDPAFNIHYYGGDIKPKRGKTLAIPATDRAYQAGSPSEGVIGDLFVYHYQNSQGELRAALASGTKDNAEVQYWLVPGVTVPKDDNALPEDDAVHAAVNEALDDYFVGMGLS